MKIILDTNFLIYCAKEKIDYMEKIDNLINQYYEVVVPFQVIEELKKIMNKIKIKIPKEKRKPKFKKTTGRDKEAASLSLQLIDKYIEEGKIKKISAEGKIVDEALINLAKENNENIICTLDREMRKKLPRVILINKNKKLIITR